jgi:hypothetical protein
MQATQRSLATALLLTSLAFGQTSTAEDINSLSDAEDKQNFKLLFDGKTTSGWEHKGNWLVKDGALTREGKGGGLTYTTSKIPDDFELHFQWKVAAGSNSGIYYRPGQYEYQILDNKKHRDGINPRTSAASLYFCVAPARDATRPVGQWNQARVICQGTVIQHWLNGEKVIDFDYTDPQYASHVERLGLRGGKLTARGRNLMLQDHGDPVWYRGFKLRTLPAGEKLDRKPVQEQKMSAEALKKEQEVLSRFKK